MVFTTLLVSLLQAVTLAAPPAAGDFHRPDPPPCVYLTKPSCLPAINDGSLESGVETGLLVTATW